MKSPRFLAALAMAAVLTTGVTAHASVGDFTEVTTGANGQQPMLKADIHEATLNSGQTIDAEGEIRVDGKFTKTINNFPTPTENGHYLRVTMPIKMDFTYDVDSDIMTSAQGTVVNNSVEATGILNNQPNTGVLTPKKVKMSIVDFADSAMGTQNMNDDVKFVTNADGSTGKVELPFQLYVTGTNGQQIRDYSIAKIKENAEAVKLNPLANAINPIEIDPNTSVKIEINKIQGQKIGNKELITNQTSLTSHSLKLKFEYVAN